MRFFIIAGILVCCLLFSGYLFASEDSHGGGEEDHGSNMGFWKTMCFLVIVVLLFFGARKPIKQGMADRTKSIETDIEDAKTQLETAEELNSKIAERLSVLPGEVDGLKSENEEIIQKSVARLQGEKKTKLARVEELLAHKLISEEKRAQTKATLITVDHAIEKVQKKISENPELVSDFRRNFDDILNQVKK